LAKDVVNEKSSELNEFIANNTNGIGTWAALNKCVDRDRKTQLRERRKIILFGSTFCIS
jgi:hypothetical protein